jgi:hypothetical protein
MREINKNFINIVMQEFEPQLSSYVPPPPNAYNDIQQMNNEKHKKMGFFAGAKKTINRIVKKRVAQAAIGLTVAGLSLGGGYYMGQKSREGDKTEEKENAYVPEWRKNSVTKMVKVKSENREIELKLYGFDGEWVTESWYDLLNACRNAGWKGKLISGVRTYEKQLDLWRASEGAKKKGNRGFAFHPDKSNHVLENSIAKGEWAIPVDVGNPEQLIAVAKKFGVELHQPYYPKNPRERHHVEAKGSFSVNNVVSAAKNVPLKKIEKRVDFNVINEVVKAIALLKEIKTGNDLDFINKGEGKLKDKLAKSNVLLAIRKDKKGSIEYVTIKQNGDLVTKNKNYEVKKLTGVGVASEYQVKRDGEFYHVLALKMALEIKGQGVIEVIYTPYSPAYDTPENRKLGLEFLSNLIVEGKENLRDKKVLSRAFKGKLAADTISDDLLKSLVLIEHVDISGAIKNGNLDRALIKKAVNEVLTTIALNKDLAYDYSVSPVGARGFFQFMEKTYNDISAQYPNAKLDDQAVRGLANEKNGVLAQILLTESDFGVLLRNNKQLIDSLYQNNQTKLGEFLAASYNNGVNRVVPAIKLENVDLLKYFKDRNNSETFYYVQKYRIIIDLLQKGELGK